MKANTALKRFQFYIWLGAVWLLVWIIFRLLNYPEKFGEQALNEIWRAVYLLFANILFFEYSLPMILRKRSSIIFNILTAVTLVAIQFAVISFGLYAWIRVGMTLNIYTQFRFINLIPDVPSNRFIVSSFLEAGTGFASVVYFGIAKLLYHNIRLKQTAQQMRIEKQEAELNYLKSQTNPHFLFNTLNNIYSLARAKSDQTPESILRLSKILRFMLYDTKDEFISIEKEAELITNYIELEKLRYDESMRVSFTHEIDNMQQGLPPLLLIPLIENAFKHGVSEISEQSYVDIQLSVKEQQLTLVVKNSADDSPEKNIKENIGLSNLRRQLELLYADYSLTVGQGDGEFTATLKINLASHV